MNRIRLLPEQVANQIAAGEVVERPASVVKELVENALDAGATRITVEVQAGGRSLVRVTDDGAGMNRDDALLCLERHATSKIQRAEDLAAIATMGFRGEALPSIASVSRFTLTTREKDSASPEGTQVIVNGGKIVEVKAAGSAPGTSVEVRQIFFNLPARRKFLRTEPTEAAHIQHYLTLAALACPGVAFTFVRDARTVWQLPAVAGGQDQIAALRERMRALQGGAQNLLNVDYSTEFNEMTAADDDADPSPLDSRPSTLRLWGLIGAPGVSRSTREDQHLFVNRRPVENRGLNFALLEGYHTALMKGRYPMCCLFLEIDPAAVDVNIHPAKREVKFRDERAVRRFVADAIRETLLKFHAGQDAAGQPRMPSGFSPKLPESEVSGGSKQQHGSLIERKPAAAPSAQEKPKPQPADLPNFPSALKPSSAPVPPEEQPSLKMGFKRSEAPASSTQHPASSPSSGATPHPQPLTPSQRPTPVPLLKVPLKLIGVIGRLYVVLESDRGLVLMDQHAAHERILFEQMLQRMEQHQTAPSQRLLLPETIELSARDAQFLRENLGTLTRLGVGLSEFGERTFLLDALPPFAKAPNARQFVLELVDELKAAGQGVNTLRLGEQVIARTVCRHAVKANDPLAGRELENLVNDLRNCTMPYTCPHGRPTLIEMSYGELEKKFGRVQ